MGYEMYRQLTYTIEDNLSDRNDDIPSTNKRSLSDSERANIEKYRMRSSIIIVPQICHCKC